MSRLFAEQLLYGRIEGVRSRTGRGGLQTLWRGRALSAAIVEEIEAIVRCFDTASEQRLQFVGLSDRRFLISQTRPSRGEAVDRGGRETFICRALVVDSQVFHHFADHPVRLAEANPFGADVADLLEIHGGPPAEIAPLALDGPGRVGEDARPPSGIAAETLIRGAFSARELRDAARLIFLPAAPGAAQRVFGWLFDHTPVRLREWCSFTTQTDRCTPTPGLFCFAAGTSTPAQRPFLELRLDGAKPGLSRELPLDGAGEMLVTLLASRQFRLPPDVVEGVDAACLLLAGSRPANLPRLDDGILAELLAQQPEAVAGRIENAIRPSLGHKSAVALTGWLTAHRDPAAAAGALSLLQHVDRIAEIPHLLLDLIEPWLAAGEPPPSWWRRRRLTRLATRRERRVLAHWLGRGSSSRWRRENLEAMTDVEFERSCSLLGPIPPAEFVCGRHLSKLLRDRRALEVDDRRFLDFLERAEPVAADFDQAALKDRAARLRPESRRRWERLAGEKPRLQQLATEQPSQQDKRGGQA